VRKIFALKGRPETNPLICHVADMNVAKRYARVWPATAEMLARKFWPGALTIVVPKVETIVDEATARLQTVGLRAPDHPLTLQLLREFGGALAGPSANKSSHVSPTTAAHVREELADAVMVLDGGACSVGIESTVLDLSGERAAILRPGGVSREAIESVIGPVQVRSAISEVDQPQVSPGQHAVHYAPRTRAYRFEGPTPMRKDLGSVAVIPLQGNPDEYAQRLYAVLREVDAGNYQAILVQMPPDEPRWMAVRNRLLRATKPLPPLK
jgi:L-threonylcarbamoyladenylate synthase